jgi:hypothetical protein
VRTYDKIQDNIEYLSSWDEFGTVQSIGTLQLELLLDIRSVLLALANERGISSSVFLTEEELREGDKPAA